MKTLKLAIAVLLVCLLAGQGYAQSAKERKAQRKKEQAEALAKYKAIADAKTWVIETHTIYDEQNMSYPVNQTVNFVGVVDDKMVVQLSFLEIPGWNGVGGITMEGNVTKYEVKGKEGKPITMNVRGSGAVLGTVDLQISVISSGQASCTIRTATDGTRITFAGQFVNASESSVYQGATFK